MRICDSCLYFWGQRWALSNVKFTCITLVASTSFAYFSTNLKKAFQKRNVLLILMPIIVTFSIVVRVKRWFCDGLNAIVTQYSLIPRLNDFIVSTGHSVSLEARTIDFRTMRMHAHESSLCIHGEKIHAYSTPDKLEQFCAHCHVAANQIRSPWTSWPMPLLSLSIFIAQNILE